MKDRYLEVTYRKGKPLAAYLYLPRHDGDTATRSEPAGDDMVIDRTADGRVIGIELLSPATLTLGALNETLHRLSLPPVTATELAPLETAA